MSDRPDVTLIMIRGLIASLPEDQQKHVGAAARALRDVLEEHGDFGQIALALLAAETSAKEDV